MFIYLGIKLKSKKPNISGTMLGDSINSLSNMRVSPTVVCRYISPLEGKF